MPGVTLPNMSIVTPLVAGDSGAWGGELNTALTLIDAHDHSPGKGVQVPIAGLNINNDFTLHGQWALINAAATQMSQVPPSRVSSFTNALWVSDGTGGTTLGELYWRTTGGVNVKLTAGNSINTTLVGGIVGDYTSVGAQVSYDNANLRYLFKEASATGWARLASGEVRIFPTSGVGAIFVGQACPGGIGSSYTMTWPTALPGSTLGVQVASSGQISFSNTFASALVAPDFKVNANTVLAIGACGFVAINSNARVTDAAGNTAVNLNGGAGNASMATMPLPIRTGDRVNSVKVFIQKTTSNTTTITATLRDLDNTAGTSFSTDTAATSANNPGFTTLTITPASPHALAANHSMSVAVNITAGAGTSDNVFGVEISYDRP